MADWSGYYAWGEGREVRPLLLRALELVEPGAAIDLGSGSGIEALALLERVWRVLAVDNEVAAAEHLASRVPAEMAPRLAVRTVAFEDLDALPPADLVHAGFAMPFCPPDAFERFASVVTGCLRPGGVLAAQLFGDRDTWVGQYAASMTFHTRSEVDALLAGLDVVAVEEEENDRPAFSGPKHWHLFHVLARRPPS